MVLVFILCTIIILMTLGIFLILLSSIRLKINDLEISNVKENPKNYELVLSLYLFNKIKWLSIRLNNKKMRKMYSKLKLEKIDFKKLEKNFKLEYLKYVSKIKPKISYMELNIDIDTENAVLTSFLVVFISSLISIILPTLAKKYKKDNYKYKVVPLYINKNIYEIKFNCIIEVKMVHIINIIYIFLKKRRVDKNERTSNRRSYGYSYE